MNTEADTLPPAVFRKKWRISARLEKLSGLLEGVQSFLAAAGWSAAATHPVLLAVEELGTNTVKYGYPASAPGHLEVSLAVTAAETALVLRDDGQAFDPTAAAPPDLQQSVEDRPIGGMGLHLVRQQSARFEYRRLATGRNEVRLLYRRTP